MVLQPYSVMKLFYACDEKWCVKSLIKALLLEPKICWDVLVHRDSSKIVFIALSGSILLVQNLSLVACWKNKVLLQKHHLKNSVLKNKCTCNYMFSKMHTCSVYFTDKLSHHVQNIRIATPLPVQLKNSIIRFWKAVASCFWLL